jgi:hypothetical protein
LIYVPGVKPPIRVGRRPFIIATLPFALYPLAVISAHDFRDVSRSSLAVWGDWRARSQGDDRRFRRAQTSRSQRRIYYLVRSMAITRRRRSEVCSAETFAANAFLIAGIFGIAGTYFYRDGARASCPGIKLFSARDFDL